MIRTLIYLLIVIAMAIGAAWLADNPGRVSIDWRGYRLELTFIWLAVLLLAAIVLSAVLSRLFRYIRKGYAEKRALARYRRSYDELGWGLNALIAGDGDKARRHAEQFARLAGTNPVSRMLTGQAALAQGDMETARENFAALESDARTRAVALRGALAIAGQTADHESALKIAREAQKTAPRAAWAQQSLMREAVAESDWVAAATAVRAARSAGHIDEAEANRLLAVLFLCQAGDKQESDPAEARRLTRRAAQRNPDLVPARVLGARLLHGAKRYRRARQVLMEGWARTPHPDLANAWIGLRKKESAAETYRRVQKLTAQKPDHPESRIVLAACALEAGLTGPARGHLKSLDQLMPQKRVFKLIARLAEAEENAAAAAAAKDRLAFALADPAWRCASCGAAHENWKAVCENCGAFASDHWSAGAVTTPPSSLLASARPQGGSPSEGLLPTPDKA